MSNPQPNRIRHLDSVEAAEFFVSPTSSKHLEPFVRGECSLAEAAKALGIGKTRMSYWLGKLMLLELIEQVRIEDRGRYKVPIYRATAEVFMVPLEKIPAESDEQILEIHARSFVEAERRAIIRKAREHADEWYMEYRLWNNQAQRNFVPKTDKSESPFVLSFGFINLTDSVAKDLGRNNIRKSRRGWEGSVVPFRQQIIKDDAHGVFEALRAASTRLVDLVQTAHHNL